MTERYRLHPDLAWRTVDDVVFLLTVDSRYHQIDDEVGVRVWRRLAAAPVDHPPALDELVADVVAAFEVEADLARNDLSGFLGGLVTAGALERAT